ncbi:uncharacterized protein LOC108044536 [Drosophila rhopaloa]|uniref:Uncharacterized protein LOC108044536 n=1 Tax=Drosophila rhopaloa TaxID=1041015 RepID=A0A6P4F168_DRORH|nr:uncharacterized protein LOC108044536 [Drosophila rhopaloa]
MSGNTLGFPSNIDCVRWYRGMSPVQTEACGDLLHALRDDMEQGSTYRVRHCVSKLGVEPLLESAQIKTIMVLSQGSDLAFLWFLWELGYKHSEDSDPELYTVNEQLLLSGIAHLDMPATLRALDALLPPGSHSTKRSSQHQTFTKKRSVRMSRSSQKVYALPYFAPPVRPRRFISKGKLRAPESRLRFPEYSQFTDTMHQVPNESSRWFAQYQFDPARRIITKLLTEELIGLNLEPLETTKMLEPLCETHRFLKKAVNMQRQEIDYSSLQRCLSQLDVPRAEIRARRKRIVQDLEKESQCVAGKICGECRKPFSQDMSTRNECGNMLSSPRKNNLKKNDHSMVMYLGLEKNPSVHLCDQTNDNLIKVMLMQKKISHRCGAGDFQIQDVDVSLEERKDINMSPKRKISRSSRSRSSHSRISHHRKVSPKGRKVKKDIVEEPPYIPTTKFQNLADLIPACSRTLPCLKRRSSTRCPEPETFTTRNRDGFQLNYHKIYDMPGLPDDRLPWEDDLVDLEDKQPVIEKFCIDALKNGKCKSGKEFQRDKFLSPVLKAAASCAVDMFRTNVANGDVGEIPAEKDQRIKNDLIDPNNDQQIEDLLKAALKVLRGNPHYVLATFSNAHKMPVLLDWVADRYGKTFSRKEMHNLVETSFRIYERFYQGEKNRRRKTLRLRKSLTDHVGPITYASYNQFMCQVKKGKADFYDKLNNLALEQTRLTWLALRGYSHLGGHIRDTFFAYMPAKQDDLNRHHVWQSNDYRDMVKLRLRSRPTGC